MIEYKIGVWLDRSVKELKIAKETVLQEVENYIKATKEVFEDQEKIIKLYKDFIGMLGFALYDNYYKGETVKSLVFNEEPFLQNNEKLVELFKQIKEIEENE